MHAIEDFLKAQSEFDFMEQIPIRERGYRVGIIGATGLVGRTLLRVLAERRFPVSELQLYGSAGSEGQVAETPFGHVGILTLDPRKPPVLDFAFMAAGDDVARDWGWRLARRGAVVIDKSAYFRDKEYAPLVVPEVNGGELTNHRGIIANPNCITIPLVMALAPLNRAFRLRSVVAVSFQSVSGGGRDGMLALERELEDAGVAPSAYPKRIAYNVIPWIGKSDGAHSGEELKIIRETRRILSLPRLPIRATAVRVPTMIGHAAAVHAEFWKRAPVEKARRLLDAAVGIEVIDDPEAQEFPTPLDAAGRDEVLIGRLRRDRGGRGLALWVVTDNLRKGAATNAVQIAEAIARTRPISQPE